MVRFTIWLGRKKREIQWSSRKMRTWGERQYTLIGHDINCTRLLITIRLYSISSATGVLLPGVLTLSWWTAWHWWGVSDRCPDPLFEEVSGTWVRWQLGFMHLIQMVGCPPELVQGMCHWDVIDTCHLGEMLTLEDWGVMCSVGVGLTLEGYGRLCPGGVGNVRWVFL